MAWTCRLATACPRFASAGVWLQPLLRRPSWCVQAESGQTSALMLKQQATGALIARLEHECAKQLAQVRCSLRCGLSAVDWLHCELQAVAAHVTNKVLTSHGHCCR